MVWDTCGVRGKVCLGVGEGTRVHRLRSSDGLQPEGVLRGRSSHDEQNCAVPDRCYAAGDGYGVRTVRGSDGRGFRVGRGRRWGCVGSVAC